MSTEELRIKARIGPIRKLANDEQGSTEWFEAAGLAQTVLHDTVGGNHPLMGSIKSALEKGDFHRALAAARAVIKLFDEGGLASPRLAIAHELEGDLLNLAQSQTEAAEKTAEPARKQVHLERDDLQAVLPLASRPSLLRWAS